MGTKLKVGSAVMILFIALSCSSKLKWRPPEPDETYPVPDLQYVEDAIQIRFKADEQVNLFGNLPHAIHVCIYQLRDPNQFNRLVEQEETIPELLGEKCGLADASVATSKPLTLQEGDEETIIMDRGEGAKYIGIVAGYYSLKKDGSVRLFDIPVVVAKKSAGCLKSTLVSKLEAVKVDVILGPTEIETIQIQ